MAMNPVGLASEIADALGQPVNAHLIGWSTGVISHVLMGVATFANIPGPHPISGLIGATMAALVASNAGYPGTTPQLIGYCTAITTHIMTAGSVTYTSPILNPPAVPPPAAYLLGGTISGLNGNLLASMVAINMGQLVPTPELTKKCTAIANHIMTNAQVNLGVIL